MQRQARRYTQTKALTNVGCVAQVKPGTLGSTDRAALDNQWATYFLIDPTSGFAPMAWQCAVGPVVLFRPGGAAISIKQVCCMESFLDRLLDTFSDVAPGALLEWMTPLHFGRFAASFNARHNDDGGCLRTEAYSRLSLRNKRAPLGSEYKTTRRGLQHGRLHRASRWPHVCWVIHYVYVKLLQYALTNLKKRVML